MAEYVKQGFDIAVTSSNLSCWQKFLKSRKDHKKRYFFFTCLLKFGAFVSFVVLAWLRLVDYLSRPDYVAVCQYVISKDLDFQVDEDCTIRVDNEKFTCDTEFGDKPSNDSYSTNYRSSFIAGPKHDEGYEVNLGYGIYSDSKSAFNSSYLGNYTQENGQLRSSPSHRFDSAVALSPRGSKFSGYSRVDSNSSYPASSSAESAQHFTERDMDGVLKVCFIAWIIINLIIRVINCVSTYRTQIIKSIPKPKFLQTAKHVAVENVLEYCIATTIYSIELPTYGDCLECWPAFMCSEVKYLMLMGFFWTLFIICTRFCCERKKSCVDWLRDQYGCNEGCGWRCAFRCCSTNMFFFAYIYLIVVVLVTLLDFYSSIYSGVQTVISTFYYFLFLSYEDAISLV